MKEKRKEVKIKTRLNVKLTDQEATQRAEALVDVTENLKDMDLEFKMIKKDWTLRINHEKDIASQLSRSASTKRELQSVVAVQVFDLIKKETWFAYKGEEYERRPLTMMETDQLGNKSLFNDDPELEGKVDDDTEEGPTDDNAILKVVNSEKKVTKKKDNCA
jgi:hypothetical protein